MARAIQKRTLKTREKFLNVAREIIAEKGYSSLRVEDVVTRAGTAKGTLFAHFGDKDGLMAVIIGAQIVAHLDRLESQACPRTPKELVDRLGPLMEFAANDRMVFDLLLRYSGSIGELVDETITQFFLRQVEIIALWVGKMQDNGRVRADQSPLLLAEGVQAFQVHVLGLCFCMDHSPKDPPATALRPFVQAWLAPSK